ncbi:MAG TPA: HlyD family efflux transporter periplasmic adaptor subunit [Gemmatimonadaceae bacterium]|nr:HlyD family efflux transporter periplasmic adaptor subunit [Gemmatimonadaceae bacterium]
MMPRSKRRALLWTAAVAGIAAIAAAAMRPNPVDVEVGVVARSALRTTVDAEARTRVRERFVVTAPVTGQLERVRVRPGDLVRAGQIVARITPLPLDAASLEAVRARVTSAQAAQLDAEARVRQAEQASALATRNAERYRVLDSAGGASSQQREEAELSAHTRAEDAAAARSRAQAARAELWAARAALPRHAQNGLAAGVEVFAPATGRVLEVSEPSARVTSAGNPLLVIGRQSDLEIVADVLSEDAVRIPPNAAVELLGWGGDTMLRGTVRRIEPSAITHVSALGVEEQRVSVIITPLSAPRALGDGFHLDAHIVTWEGRDVLIVPASAVFTAGTASHVFVVENDRAFERRVLVGHRSDAGAEIISGLSAGDLVVLFPSDRVRTGARLRYTAPTTAAMAEDPRDDNDTPATRRP